MSQNLNALLIAALTANNAVLSALAANAGAGDAAAASGTAGSTTTATKTAAAAKKAAAKKDAAPASEHTRAEMQAALNDVKEASGAAVAKSIIKSAGGVDKMQDIPDDKIDAVYDAAKAELGEGGDDGDDGL